MKLFCIKNDQTRRVIPDLYFESKPMAKSERDKLAAETSQKHVVVAGPDHRKYKHKD